MSMSVFHVLYSVDCLFTGLCAPVSLLLSVILGAIINTLRVKVKCRWRCYSKFRLIAMVTLTSVNQDSASGSQSRVRHVIGRRRAGLGRYVTALSRELGQDSVDPIADMLSQLTGR